MLAAASTKSEARLASLLIRNVDQTLHDQLKSRARAHRRSLEEEVRETLRGAVARDAGSEPDETLLEISARIFGPTHGVDLDIPPRALEP